MEISNQKPYFFMSDVYKFHIGKWVRVYTAHPEPIVGTLHNYDNGILHIIDKHGSINTYISVMQVCAISGDDKP